MRVCLFALILETDIEYHRSQQCTLKTKLFVSAKFMMCFKMSFDVFDIMGLFLRGLQLLRYYLRRNYINTRIYSLALTEKITKRYLFYLYFIRIFCGFIFLKRTSV